MRVLKPLAAAAVLILVSLVPVRGQSPPPGPPPAVAYVPSYACDCAGPYAGLPAKTFSFGWGPGLIGRHLGDKLNRRHVWTISHTRFQFFRPKATCFASAQAAMPTPQSHSHPVLAAPGKSVAAVPSVTPTSPESVTLQAEEAPPAPAIRELTPVAEIGRGDQVQNLPSGRTLD